MLLFLKLVFEKYSAKLILKTVTELVGLIFFCKSMLGFFEVLPLFCLVQAWAQLEMQQENNRAARQLFEVIFFLLRQFHFFVTS